MFIRGIKTGKYLFLHINIISFKRRYLYIILRYLFFIFLYQIENILDKFIIFIRHSHIFNFSKKKQIGTFRFMRRLIPALTKYY